jgi:hypothetical protein
MATFKQYAIVLGTLGGLALVGYNGIRDTVGGLFSTAWKGLKTEQVVPVHYRFQVTDDSVYRLTVPRTAETAMDNFIDMRKGNPPKCTALELQLADADDKLVDGIATADAVSKLSNGAFKHAATHYRGPFPMTTIAGKTAPHFDAALKPGDAKKE